MARDVLSTCTLHSYLQDHRAHLCRHGHTVNHRLRGPVLVRTSDAKRVNKAFQLSRYDKVHVRNAYVTLLVNLPRSAGFNNRQGRPDVARTTSAGHPTKKDGVNNGVARFCVATLALGTLAHPHAAPTGSGPWTVNSSVHGRAVRSARARCLAPMSCQSSLESGLLGHVVTRP